jgi:hypothetical protein
VLGWISTRNRKCHEIEVTGLSKVQFKGNQETIYRITGSAGHMNRGCHGTSTRLYIFYGKEHDKSSIWDRSLPI